MTTTRTVAWASSPGCTRLDPATAGFWRSLLRSAYAWDVWDKVSARVRAGALGPAARLMPITRGWPLILAELRAERGRLSLAQER
jgi:hypothetical protein